MKGRLARGGLIAAGVAVVLAGVLNPWSLPWAARWLDVGQDPQKADAVVLLNGSLSSRPFVASALVHGGWAPMIILNTVSAHANQVTAVIPPTDEITLKILAYGGVPRDRVVLLPSAAQTTFDEAKAVADYLADHPVKRLMIVTEGPHARRSRWIFQRVLAGRPIEISMVSAPADEFDSSNWWRSEAGFLFVVSEYFKLVYYWLRYGWPGPELGLCVILAAVFLTGYYRRRKQGARSRAGQGSRE
jgi:uncharacterized SAM-binding protein YcdF (DUF218 family)